MSGSVYTVIAITLERFFSLQLNPPKCCTKVGHIVFFPMFLPLTVSFFTNIMSQTMSDYQSVFVFKLIEDFVLVLVLEHHDSTELFVKIWFYLRTKKKSFFGIKNKQKLESSFVYSHQTTKQPNFIFI